MTGTAHTCPVPGCETLHPRSRLMCSVHWHRVPKPIRDELWRAYRNEGVLSEAYQDARDACIGAVTA